MRFLSIALIVLKKDFAVEMRSREILYTTLFFAVSCVMVFSFAFVREGVPVEGAAPGILWVAVSFAGTLALGRTFERERQGDTIKGLLLAPAPRPAIYVGKLMGIVGMMLAVEALLVPMVAFLFQAPLLAHPLQLVALLVCGSVGFASVGTVFAAMLLRTRARDVLLPMLLYPVTIPVMIAGTLGTAALLESPVNDPAVTMWIMVLLSIDTVFVTLALWTFEPLMTE